MAKAETDPMEEDDKENWDEARKPAYDIREVPGYYLARIEGYIASGRFVDGPELAHALRGNGFRPMTAPVLDYLCRYLEGKVERPKGRKPDDPLVTRRRNMVIRGYYRYYKEYLTERKHRYGKPAGWTKYDCPPAEIAARMVAKLYLSGEESWRSVQNIDSSQK